MPYLNDHAIVLSTRKYKEKDKLVFLLTSQNGLVKSIARSASGPRSKFGTSLEILSLVKIQVFRRNEDMEFYSLCQCLLADQSPLMEGDFETLSCGSFLAEAANAVAGPEQKEEQLFHLLREARDLVKQGASRQLVALGYLYKVLQQVGIAPIVAECAECGKRNSGDSESWRFSPQSGSIFCGSCGSGLQEAVALMPSAVRTLLAFDRYTLRETARVEADKTTLEGIWRILAQHAEFHLHLSFRSLKFLFTTQ